MCDARVHEPLDLLHRVTRRLRPHAHERVERAHGLAERIGGARLFVAWIDWRAQCPWGLYVAYAAEVGAAPTLLKKLGDTEAVDRLDDNVILVWPKIACAFLPNTPLCFLRSALRDEAQNRIAPGVAVEPTPDATVGVLEGGGFSDEASQPMPNQIADR